MAVRKHSGSNPIVIENEARNIRKIARDHYVVARVSLAVNYSITGCLIAHQSLEMYLKGIIRLFGGKPDGHYLDKLVGYGAFSLKIAELIEMAKNTEQMTLLKQLYEVYHFLRFGEDAGFFIENKNTVLELDAIVFLFEQMYAKKLNESRPPRLYVYETWKNRFLKFNDYFNDYFTPEMITNNSDAQEKDLPELSGDSAWKQFSVANFCRKKYFRTYRNYSLSEKNPKRRTANYAERNIERKRLVI